MPIIRSLLADVVFLNNEDTGFNTRLCHHRILFVFPARQAENLFNKIIFYYWGGWECKDKNFYVCEYLSFLSIVFTICIYTCNNFILFCRAVLLFAYTSYMIIVWSFCFVWSDFLGRHRPEHHVGVNHACLWPRWYFEPESDLCNCLEMCCCVASQSFAII